MYNTFSHCFWQQWNILTLMMHNSPACSRKKIISTHFVFLGMLKSYFLKSRDLANAFISHLALSTMILPPKGITTLFQHILWFLYCKCSRVLLVSSTCIWAFPIGKNFETKIVLLISHYSILHKVWHIFFPFMQTLKSIVKC